MRIAFISTMGGARWGGSEELWAAGAKAALDSGCAAAVSVQMWRPHHPKLDELAAAGALVLERWRPRLGPLGPYVQRVLRPFASVARFRPDVVVISQGAAFDMFGMADGAELRRLISRLGVPYCIICHGNAEANIPGDAHRALIRDTFARAAWVGFVAQRSRRLAERQLAGRIENAVILRNPVNLRETGLLPWPGGDGLRMAYVGRIDSNKNLDSLLEALGGGAWRGRDWRLTVVGEGPLLGYARELAAYFGVAERVEFRGHAEDMRAVWRDLHLCVLPSRAESMPIVVFEAMLCGRPVVATDVGGVPELVVEGVTGFLAPSPMTGEIAAALERAWEARAGLEEMGRRAHERAMPLYDPRPGKTLLTRVLGASARRHMGAKA